MRHPFRSLLLPLAIAFTAAMAYPQTAATVVGDVYDPSGNVIPNASVTVTSAGTGFARTVQTNATGQYRITPLNPGTYSLQVKAEGFKSQLRSGIDLQVSAVLEVDFTLALGSVSETVEVTGAATLLQTEESSVGNVVAAKELERLPVNGRNYTRLILLMPGTSSVTRSQSRGTPQSNSIPPSAGTEGRNISPTLCCSGVNAISTLKTCCFPSRVTMTSFSFGSSA